MQKELGLQKELIIHLVLLLMMDTPLISHFMTAFMQNYL